MNKRFLFFIILLNTLFSGKNLFAQKHDQTEIDSLLELLSKAKDDKNKVNLLVSLMYAHLTLKPEDGLQYEKPALELAEKLNWPNGILTVKFASGRIYWRLNKFDDALKCHFDALKIAEQLKDKKNIVSSLIGIGQDYGDHANYPEAINYFNKGLAIAREIGDKPSMSNLYSLISWVYGKQGNYPESAKNNLSAIKISAEIGDKWSEAVYMTNIADNYSMLGLDSIALRYLDSALVQLKEQDDIINVGYTYIGIGAIYQRFKNYAEAQKYFELGLKTGTEINDKQVTADAYRNIAESFVARGNDTEALKNYLLAIESLKSLEVYPVIASLKINVGSLYIRLKKYALAKKYFDDAQVLSRKIGSEEITKDYYGGLELLDSATGKWKDAYLHYKTSIRLRDKLYNDENSKKVMQSSMQYEFDKKEAATKAEQEKKDAISQQEVQKQKIVKNSFIAGFILVMLLVGVTYNRYRLKQKSHAELSKTLHELKETQDQLVQSEKMAAFGVVASRVAHEIHNPLNFINNFSELSEDLIQDFVSSTDEHEKRDIAKSLTDNLKKINHHGKRAESIVKQLQEHTRSGTAHEFFEEED